MKQAKPIPRTVESSMATAMKRSGFGADGPSGMSTCDTRDASGSYIPATLAN